MMSHVLLEVFCTKNFDRNVKAPLPDFCPGNGCRPSYHCLSHRCPYLDFTSCENTLCYIGKQSDMECGILFGGDMEEGNPAVGLDAWQEIAKAKIEEAYDQYMEKKQTKL